MSPEKNKAFAAALECMPEKLNNKEIVLFFLGVCHAYNVGFEEIAELFTELAHGLMDAQPAANMFEDEKLQALFASNPFDASPDVKR